MKGRRGLCGDHLGGEDGKLRDGGDFGALDEDRDSVHGRPGHAPALGETLQMLAVDLAPMCIERLDPQRAARSADKALDGLMRFVGTVVNIVSKPTESIGHVAVVVLVHVRP